MKLNWANRVTIVRILLIAPFVSLMLKINDPAISHGMRHAARYAAFAIFMCMAASDAIDGFLARMRGQVTKLGSFLDPTADKLLITCACLLLASERAGVGGFLLPPTVVVVILAKDIMLLVGFVIIYFVTAGFYIAPATAGKAATCMQLAMVAAILMAPEMSGFFPWWIWLLRGLWWSAAILAVAATLIYIRSGSRYINAHEQKHTQDRP